MAAGKTETALNNQWGEQAWARTLQEDPASNLSVLSTLPIMTLALAGWTMRGRREAPSILPPIQCQLPSLSREAGVPSGWASQPIL